MRCMNIHEYPLTTVTSQVGVCIHSEAGQHQFFLHDGEVAVFFPGV